MIWSVIHFRLTIYPSFVDRFFYFYTKWLVKADNPSIFCACCVLSNSIVTKVYLCKEWSFSFRLGFGNLLSIIFPSVSPCIIVIYFWRLILVLELKTLNVATYPILLLIILHLQFRWSGQIFFLLLRCFKPYIGQN